MSRADEELVDAYALGLGHGVDYGVRDVFRLQPLQVHEAAEALAGVLVRDVVRELGVNGPRPHDRHPDVVFQQLLPQAFRDSVHSVLGPSVDPARVAGHLPPGHAADVHEVSRALLLHVPDGRVCRVEEAHHIHFEHGPPLIREALTHRREQHDARVVDKDVDTSELLDRLLNEVVGLLLISNIALNRDSLPAVVGYPLDELVEALLSASPGTVASPMPLEAPVTTATLPFNLPPMCITSLQVREYNKAQLLYAELWVLCTLTLGNLPRLMCGPLLEFDLLVAPRRGTLFHSYPRYGMKRCFHTLRLGYLMQSLGKWPPDLYTEPRWPGMLLAQR